MHFFRARCVALLALATSAFGFTYNSTTGELTYSLGLFGPFTSVSQQYLAAAVAFDIDFRKHFDPDLAAAFGSPVVDIPNLNANLRIQPIIGTSDSDAAVGLQTVGDWVTGVTPFPVVDAVVGGAHSLFTPKVSGLCDAFGVPQVSWGATNLQFSDKGQYPFFARTVPPDSLQGAALWAWVLHFGIPSVTVLYTDELYGTGLFRSLEAEAAPETHRIDGVAHPFMANVADFNTSEADKALTSVRHAGSRFILLCMSSQAATFMMYSMEQADMLYGGSYQIIGSEGVALQRGQLRAPSRGVPVGFQKLYPRARGIRFERFAALWTNMTHEHVYGDAARARYFLDYMKVKVENASAPILLSTDLISGPTELGVGFLFDAAYTLTIAINDLLNQGVAPEAVKGARLVEQIRHVAFQGVTGNVSFDDHLDRSAPYELWNARSPNITDVSTITRVGVIDSSIVELLSMPVWASGNSSLLPPPELMECAAGFEMDSTLRRCMACTPGIGCGFDPQMGFPLAVLGRITGLTTIASAVLFDLDFRKNFEPDLVERFGPPIVEVPDLHPDLRAQVLLGHNDFDMATGVETALQWMTGKPEHGIPRVAGVIGDVYTFISAPVATNCEVFEVPQISHGSQTAGFSNKDVYPWFFRTIPPDSLTMAALWGFLNYCGIPSMVIVFLREQWGEGRFNALADLAVTSGNSGRIVGVGIDFDTSQTVEDMTPFVEQAQAASTKFMAFGILSRSLAATFQRALELAGLLYGSGAYQIFESVGVPASDDGQGPSMGSPIGSMNFVAVTAGTLYQRYLDMLANMTNDDMWSPEAMTRYQLDRLLVTPDPLPIFDPGAAPTTLASLLVDALYSYIFAMNNLLNAGLPPESIHGKLLLDELTKTDFYGVSGRVTFDANQDRQGNYLLQNLRPIDENGTLGIVEVASWESATNTFTFDMELVWARGLVSAVVPDILVACAPGQRWDEVAQLCSFCPSNWYSSGGVRAAAMCEACAPGFVSNLRIGATSCLTCEVGYFRTIADENCTACPAGYFGASLGQSACVECPVGEYASTAGLSQCDVCGAGRQSEHLFTTMTQIQVDGDVDYWQIVAATSVEQCGCNEGTRRDGAGECVPCTEGMICLGLNDVRVQEGYFAEEIVGGDLSIFRCHGESKRCSGGFPGATCASGRKGITCSECEDGMTPNSDGSCVECGGSDLVPFMTLVVLGCLALIFTYHIIATQNRVTQSHSLLLCAIAVGQLITVSQQLGVIGMLALDWQEPIKSFMKLIGVMTFNIEVLRLNCISSRGPVERFIVKICIIFVTIVLMVVIHCFYAIFRYKGKFRDHDHAIIGAIGTIFMVFNIAVTSTVLEPLQCEDHPSEMWTIHNYPSIICWETSDHSAMLAIGMGAFIVVPLNYLVACVAIVRQFPSRMRAGDERFLKAFYFLFFRFQPQHYAYVLITTLRSFLVAAVLVVPDVTTQVFLLQFILLLAYSTTLYWCPWRVQLANLLDALFGGGAVLLVCLASLFISSENKNFTGIAWLTTIFIVGMLIMGLCAVVYGLCRRYLRGTKPFQYFLCHHKNGSGAYTRLLKMHLETAPKIKQKVFVDSDNLDNLDRLFDHVGNDASTLLVVRSEAIFTRPYCVGEMCTAHLKRVPCVTVGLPNSSPPDDAFLEELANRLPDLHVLTESGMSLEMLQDALVWIRSEPCIDVPDVVTGAVMAFLVDKIISEQYFDVDLNMSRRTVGTDLGSPRRLNQSLTLYDFSSMEAAATALILKMCLAPLLLHESEKIPQPMESPELSDFPKAMLVLCMNGTFEQLEVLQVLHMMSKLQCCIVPVIGEQGFRFPSKDTQALARRCEAAGLEKMGDSIAGVLATVFKEIAVDFNAQYSGQTLLNLGAQIISRRLLSIHGASAKVAVEKKVGSYHSQGRQASSNSTFTAPLCAPSVTRYKGLRDYQDDEGDLVSAV